MSENSSKRTTGHLFAYFCDFLERVTASILRRFKASKCHPDRRPTHLTSPAIISGITVAHNPGMGADTQNDAANDSPTIQPGSRSKFLGPAAPFTSTLKALARLNRNATWVATGLLGPVLFAAVMVAIRDPHSETDDVTDTSQRFKTDLSPDTNFAVAGSSEKSAGEATLAQNSPSVLGFTSQPKHAPPAVQANTSSSPPALRPLLARNARPKIPHFRHASSKRPGIVSLKLRLIAFFQSLVPNERPRGRQAPLK
jgi:hypothetical protein